MGGGGRGGSRRMGHLRLVEGGDLRHSKPSKTSDLDHCSIPYFTRILEQICLLVTNCVVPFVKKSVTCEQGIARQTYMKF